MVLESLLLTSLITELSFSESGVRVSLQKEPREVALFFSIDNNSNRNSTFRADVGINANENICDGLVFFAKEHRKVFCLVEMKGGNVSRATEQIINTHRHLSSSLTSVTRGKSCSNQCRSIVWKAYIAVNSSSPFQVTSEIRQRLTNTFGKDNFVILRGGDFGRFIRS